MYCILWQNGATYPIGPLSVLSVLSCLSVTLVCYGQTVRWIKMPLGTEVGFSPDGEGTQFPSQGAWRPPHFRPMSIVAKRLDGSSCHLVRMTSSHITVVTLRILLVPISVHASTHHTRWAITRPVRSIVHVFKTPQLTRNFWSTSTMLWFRHVKESTKTKLSSVSLCCKAVLPC